MARIATVLVAFSASALGAAAAPAADARPASERLLPATTKAFLSIPDVAQLAEHWRRTDMGALLSDPAMAPFLEDLRRQLRGKLSEAGVRLGLAWDDLRGVYGGEACLAMCQPGGQPEAHAVIALVDVSGHADAAAALLEKIDRQLRERGAERSEQEAGGAVVTSYTLPQRPDETAPRHAHYAIHNDWLAASDDQATLLDVLARMSDPGSRGDTLQDAPAFAAVMDRCRESLGAMRPDVRWFIDPFGYAQTLRAAAGGRRGRGQDLLGVLARNGFDAVRGVGGCVLLTAGEHQLVHATFVYAPPAPDAEPGQKYLGAARILDFPNAEPAPPADWIPRELAVFLAFRWNVKAAFEYVKPLVNDLAGAEVFEDVLEGLEKDPLGPQINVRRDLVARLGDRITVISNYQPPTTPQSDQLLVAIEVTDSETVAETVNKAMESDPDAHRREFEGHVIWEILREPEQEVELSLQDPLFDAAIPGLELETPGLEPLVEVADAAPVAEPEPLFSNPAVAVARGQLIFASQIDLLEHVLRRRDPRDSLSQAQDFRLVADALDKLGAGSDSFRCFIRMDEALHGAYDLIRENRMPESESLLGKLLNRALGPEEAGVVRQQQIDGARLPEFQVARRYLGPGGLYARSEPDGWFIAGCFLSKHPGR